MPSSGRSSSNRCPKPNCCAGTPRNASSRYHLPAHEYPLWELVGVDDADEDPGGMVNIDEVVYGGRR